MLSSRRLHLFWAAILAASVIAGCNPSSSQQAASQPGDSRPQAVPSGKHWSAPPKFTLNQKEYVGASQVRIRPAEDTIVHLKQGESFSVRIHWQRETQDIALGVDKEVAATIIYPVRDRNGKIRFFHLEALVKLGPEGTSSATDVKYGEAGSMPLDYSYTDERDCLLYLTKDLDDRAPISNLLVLRCR
jgi:hypothetical protein